MRELGRAAVEAHPSLPAERDAKASRQAYTRGASPRWTIHFGKYELLSRINIGGMAEIVKACDTSLPSRPLVAVKRILPHLCEDAQYRTMFLDESRVLARLDHPNIIHAFEIGEIEATPYIALDFVDGPDARALFHRARSAGGPVPVAVACFIIASVCEGLHCAHEQRDDEGEPLGLVHRDVSLQNVLLSYAGDVKITDFGIAVSSQNEARTEVGIVKGKFGYMSPEQIRGAPLDRRSDVFAAGICLYELLTGERLFVGDNDFKAVERVRNVEIDPPSKLNRNVPSELEGIVMRALSKHPRDRQPTALDLRQDLLAFMAAAGERCTREDLGAYLRGLFVDEYASSEEDVTQIGEESPELRAARAELQRPALAGPGELEARAERDTSVTPSHSFLPAPLVPPLVPNPESIPGTLESPALAVPNGRDVPEPRALVMDWDEYEPTTISRGFDASEDAPEPLMPDDEVTRVRTDEPLPGLAAAFASVPQPLVSERPPPQVAPVTPARPLETVRWQRLRDPDRRLKLAGGAVALLLAVLAGIYWSRESGVATIHLTTEPRDPVVTVDGQRVPGSASPFVLSDLDTSVEHTIVVDKPGHQSWSTRLKLHPGQVLRLPLIQLEADRPQLPAAEPLGSAAISGAGEPAPEGAGPVAPAPTELRQTRGPRAGELADPTARNRARSADPAEPRVRSAPARAEGREIRAASAKTGTLRINTRPWSRVSIGGRVIGNTPQTAITLPAGTHRVRLTNPDFGIDETLTIEIEPGQVLTRVVDLQ